MKEETKKPLDNTEKSKNDSQEPETTWAADAQDELEDWIEEQGIQLRY